MDDNKTTDVPRRPNGTFQKGVSGRKLMNKFVGPTNKQSLADLYDAKSKKIFDALVAIIEDPNTPATARISAIKEFNDRHLGRPAQTTVVRTDSSESEELKLVGVPTEILRKIADATSRKAQ